MSTKVKLHSSRLQELGCRMSEGVVRVIGPINHLAASTSYVDWFELYSNNPRVYDRYRTFGGSVSSGGDEGA